MNSEVGLTAPLSSAAAAVTTLNVEPGGYRPWVARLSSGAAYEHAAVLMRVIAREVLLDDVRVEGGARRHRQDPARLRVDRDCGAALPAQRANGDLLARESRVR